MTIQSKSHENRVNRWAIIYSAIIAILPYLDLFPSRIFGSFTLALSACSFLVIGSLAGILFKKDKMSFCRKDLPLISFLMYICLTNIFSNAFAPGISSTTGYFSVYSTVFFVLTIVCFFNAYNWIDGVVHKIIFVFSMISTIGIIAQTPVQCNR